MTKFNDFHDMLVKRVLGLFNRKELLGRWQDIADNFYPERGAFTSSKSVGTDFVEHLSTSYPIIVRRDLGDSFGGMLRPRGQQWFETKVNREDTTLDSASRIFLEKATKAQYRAMYDRVAQFNKATKQADHDYAAFGQAVISAELNLRDNTLLYRDWHLRDVCWWENAYGEIAGVARKWLTCPADAIKYFKGNVHEEIKKLYNDNNKARAYEQTLEFMHIVMRADEYDFNATVDGAGNVRDFVEFWIDTKNKFVMVQQPRLTSYYIIPRWQTVSGSQYAFSPAVVAGLPDARLLQAMSYTLLRAGEKAVDPPMVAIQEVIQSDLALYPGGVTWADADYQGNVADAFAPVQGDYRALPIALQMHQSQQAMIETAFYINRLSMPPVTHEMTAEEARYRVQQYVRQALPLFEPIEHEYNAPICENTFELLMSVNAFGPRSDIPEALAGSDIEFKFASPLIEARDQELARTFVDSKALIAEAAAIYPGAQYMLNTETALRDALRGRGAPATWVRDEAEMAKYNEVADKKQAAMEQSQLVAMGGAAAQGAAVGGREMAALEQEMGPEDE